MSTRKGTAVFLEDILNETKVGKGRHGAAPARRRSFVDHSLTLSLWPAFVTLLRPGKDAAALG